MLKRIRLGPERGGAHLSGLREAYFGGLLCNQSATVQSATLPSREGCNHIVRFVESFQVAGASLCRLAPSCCLHILQSGPHPDLLSHAKDNDVALLPLNAFRVPFSAFSIADFWLARRGV